MIWLRERKYRRMFFFFKFFGVEKPNFPAKIKVQDGLMSAVLCLKKRKESLKLSKWIIWMNV